MSFVHNQKKNSVLSCYSTFFSLAIQLFFNGRSDPAEQSGEVSRSMNVPTFNRYLISFYQSFMLFVW